MRPRPPGVPAPAAPRSCQDRLFSHGTRPFPSILSSGDVAGQLAERIGFPIEVLEMRSEVHTSELQSLAYLVCRLLLEKKKTKEVPHLAKPPYRPHDSMVHLTN